MKCFSAVKKTQLIKNNKVLFGSHILQGNFLDHQVAGYRILLNIILKNGSGRNLFRLSYSDSDGNCYHLRYSVPFETNLEYDDSATFLNEKKYVWHNFF